MSHLRQTTTRIVTMFAAALVTVSCGGGGGGGSHHAAPSGTAVSGTAAKGLLNNAAINFYEVSSTGTVGSTSLATTHTNSSGTFSATVDAAGPVVVTATMEGSTTMLDELTGSSMPAPSGLVLHAAVSGLTSTPISVTPLTEMAYQLASAASGGLTAANIDAANATVSAAMLDGAPILTTRPIDIANYKTSTVAQQAQAKLLTALSLAAEDGSATDASGGTCSGADYGARLTCMVNGLHGLLVPGASDSIEFAPWATYLVTAYQRVSGGLVTVDGGKDVATLGMNVETTAEQSLVESVASGTALFGYDPSASPLDNTKALFADLRTNIIAARSGSDIFGIMPIVASLREDVEANVAPALRGTEAMFVAAYEAARLLQESIPGSYKWISWNIVCAYDPTTFGTADNVALCRYGTAFEEQILLTATRTAEGTYAATTQPMTYDPLGGDPSTEDDIFNLGYDGAFTPSTTIEPLAATYHLADTADAPRHADWSGPYFVTADGGQVTGELSGGESSDWDRATSTGTLSISGGLSDGAGGIELTEATFGADSSFVVTNGNGNGMDPPSVTGALSVTRLATASFVYSARVTIGEPVVDASGLIAVPEDVSVRGSVSQIGPAGEETPVFSGRIGVAVLGASSFDATEPVSDTNTATIQAQVVGSVSLSDNRVLSVSVAANAGLTDPTPEAPYSLTATYAYTTPGGIARINLSGTYDATDGFAVTVTSNSGVTAVLTRPVHGSVAGTVSADGVETATITGTTIYYSDGSSESLY